MEYELLIREAEAQDALDLIALLDQIGHESSFTSLDENGIAMSESEMQRFIHKQAQSDNQITLLAFLNEELAGVINITADHVREFDILATFSWESRKPIGEMVSVVS